MPFNWKGLVNSDDRDTPEYIKKEKDMGVFYHERHYIHPFEGEKPEEILNGVDDMVDTGNQVIQKLGEIGIDNYVNFTQEDLIRMCGQHGSIANASQVTSYLNLQTILKQAGKPALKSVYELLREHLSKNEAFDSEIFLRVASNEIDNFASLICLADTNPKKWDYSPFEKTPSPVERQAIYQSNALQKFLEGIYPYNDNFETFVSNIQRSTTAQELGFSHYLEEKPEQAHQQIKNIYDILEPFKGKYPHSLQGSQKEKDSQERTNTMYQKAAFELQLELNHNRFLDYSRSAYQLALSIKKGTEDSDLRISGDLLMGSEHQEFTFIGSIKDGFGHVSYLPIFHEAKKIVDIAPHTANMMVRRASRWEKVIKVEQQLQELMYKISDIAQTNDEAAARLLSQQGAYIYAKDGAEKYQELVDSFNNNPEQEIPAYLIATNDLYASMNSCSKC